MRQHDDGTCSRDNYAAWLAECVELTRKLHNAAEILTVAAINRKPHAVKHACEDADVVLDSLWSVVERMPDDA